MSETAARLDATGDYLESIDAGTSPLAGLSIGGYGELHYNNLDADDAASDVDMIDFHRFTRELMWLRRRHPALRGDGVRTVLMDNESRVVAFQRWVEGVGRDVMVVASL